MNYILTVTVTKSKSGKYHYKVLDESGKVVSERRSNRKYVACTASGTHYFGRLDLIGKGDHGAAIKLYSNPTPYIKSTMSAEQIAKTLESLTSIACLSPAMDEPTQQS